MRKHPLVQINSVNNVTPSDNATIVNPPIEPPNRTNQENHEPQPSTSTSHMPKVGSKSQTVREPATYFHNQFPPWR